MLINENAELRLYLVSLIRVFVAKGAISNEELRAKVESVDRSDDEADCQYAGDIM